MSTIVCPLTTDLVRVERRGKSSPGAWEQSAAVNSIRSNTAGEQRLGTHGLPGRSQEVA